MRAMKATTATTVTSKNSKKSFFALVALVAFFAFFVVAAFGIELELQENRGERGTVGFVDMDRVFQEFPETQKAKAALDAEVKSRKEALRQKKAELKKLKGELEDLKTEKGELLEALARLQAGEAAKAAAEATAVSTQPVAASTAAAVETSTAAPWVGLPGISLEPAARVTSSTGTIAVSTGAASTPPVSISSPAASQISISSAVLAQLEQKIEAKSSEIQSKDKALAEFQKKAQKELLDMENRKVQIVLGKIYQVVQELAREEGVSVIVDKNSILFGQSAVDLTDKLLKRLKGG